MTQVLCVHVPPCGASRAEGIAWTYHSHPQRVRWSVDSWFSRSFTDGETSLCRYKELKQKRKEAKKKQKARHAARRQQTEGKET